jgi:F0F1-type ATP synthase alpha subunit
MPMIKWSKSRLLSCSYNLTDHISWKDVDLNWTLISILEEDEVIRQGLFPVPGANISVSQGGSKPKTDYQWMLAQRLFENHEKYRDMFALVQTPADKANWQRKIKNRLKRSG